MYPFVSSDTPGHRAINGLGCFMYVAMISVLVFLAASDATTDGCESYCDLLRRDLVGRVTKSEMHRGRLFHTIVDQTGRNYGQGADTPLGSMLAVGDTVIKPSGTLMTRVGGRISGDSALWMPYQGTDSCACGDDARVGGLR